MRGLRRVVSVYDVNKATRLAIEAGLAKVCLGEQLMSPEGVPSVCVCACDGLPQVLLFSPCSSFSLIPLFLPFLASLHFFVSIYLYLIPKSVPSLLHHFISGRIFVILSHFTIFVSVPGVLGACLRRNRCAVDVGAAPPPAGPLMAISKSAVFYDSLVMHRTDR